MGHLFHQRSKNPNHFPIAKSMELNEDENAMPRNVSKFYSIKMHMILFPMICIRELTEISRWYQSSRCCCCWSRFIGSQHRRRRCCCRCCWRWCKLSKWCWRRFSSFQFWWNFRFCCRCCICCWIIRHQLWKNWWFVFLFIIVVTHVHHLPKTIKMKLLSLLFPMLVSVPNYQQNDGLHSFSLHDHIDHPLKSIHRILEYLIKSSPATRKRTPSHFKRKWLFLPINAWNSRLLNTLITLQVTGRERKWSIDGWIDSYTCQ